MGLCHEHQADWGAGGAPDVQGVAPVQAAIIWPEGSKPPIHSNPLNVFFLWVPDVQCGFSAQAVIWPERHCLSLTATHLTEKMKL